jgi:hypothetical protein
VSEPALNRPALTRRLMVHGCQCLPQPVKLKAGTDRVLGAGKTGTVVAVAAIQSRPLPEGLQNSQEVSVRKMNRELGAMAPSTEQLNQGIRDRDRPLLPCPSA